MVDGGYFWSWRLAWRLRREGWRWTFGGGGGWAGGAGGGGREGGVGGELEGKAETVVQEQKAAGQAAAVGTVVVDVVDVTEVVRAVVARAGDGRR